MSDDLKQLHGRRFASLTPSELEQLNHFRQRGKKWGIHIGFNTSSLDPMYLLRATTEQAADKVLREADAVVTIHFFDPMDI